MDYDRIRQQYLLEKKSQRQIAKELGISHNTVAKYCKGCAYPCLRASYSLRKLEKSIAAADLLLLDELSYASFGLEESEVLFKVIAKRSERTSTMITTNLEFSK